MNWVDVILIILAVLVGIFFILFIVALTKKGNSIYTDEPDQKNPYEGKKVIFVENQTEKVNADGVCGHLESIGNASYVESFYEKYVKRLIDIILSFGGLIVLLPLLNVTNSI